jgi:DNA-binding transcriptional ArsR family regulator
MVKSEGLDRTLSALSDPTRRGILEHLSTGPASLSELAAPSGISLPGLLKHVRILENVGLVETRREGRTRQCLLGPARLNEVSQWVETYRRVWERRLDRLETHLGERKRGKP